MTRDALKVKLGVQDVQIVELVLDTLIPTNGSPTADDLTFYGGQKANDMTAFTRTDVSYFFVDEAIGPISALGNLQFPCLIKANVTPQELNSGIGQASSEKFTATFVDFAHDDRGIDPWVDSRSYDPYERSTFWRKFKRRFPYVTARVLKYHQGYIDVDGVFDWNNFITREYSLDSLTGPSGKDKFNVVAFDVLHQQLGSKRAVAPLENDGKLAAAIDNSQTSAELDDATGYAASGTLRIEEEICDFTRSGTTLTLTRGQYNTQAASHSEGENVQETIYLNNEPIQDFVYDLCTQYGVDLSAKITKSEWDDEKNTWMELTNLTGHITEPTPITELLTTLQQGASFDLYEEPTDGKIYFKAIAPVRGTVPTINDDVIIKMSDKVEEKPSERMSRVRYYYGPVTPFTKEEDEEEWRREVRIDVNSESSDEYGQKAIFKIFNPLFDSSNRGQAVSKIARLLSGYSDIPSTLTIELDESSELFLADIVDVDSDAFVDDDGSNLVKRMQVVAKKNIVKNGVTYHRYKLKDTFFKNRYGFFAPNTMGTYDVETEENRRDYGFWSNNATPPVMSDGEPAYRWL